MILETYNPKGGFERKRCEICGRLRECAQHHVMGRKNSESVVWVCSNGGNVFYNDPCHAKIHNPTAFGLPSSWAYDNGYLVRIDGVYRPKKRKYKPLKI